MASVRQPLREIGRRAVEGPVHRIDVLRREAPYPGPSNIVLPTEITPDATLTGRRRTR